MYKRFGLGYYSTIDNLETKTETEMNQHGKFTEILEEGLDGAFAEHGYLDGVIRMWENMMRISGFENDKLIESYNFIISRSNEPFISNVLEAEIYRLNRSK